MHSRAVVSSEVLLYIFILGQTCTEIWQLPCTAIPWLELGFGLFIVVTEVV